MSKAFHPPTISRVPATWAYVNQVSLRQTTLQRELDEAVEHLEHSAMAGCPNEAQFLGFLVELLQARCIVEVGVFRGSTTLTLAQALQARWGESAAKTCKVYGLDVSAEYTATARAFWQKAHVQDMIELRIQPAIESMRELLTELGEGSVDLVFIDADKMNYGEYYELALKLVKPEVGVIAIDNTLWGGRVLDSDDACSPDTKAIKALNEKIHNDARVSMVLIPMADGLTLCRRR